MKHEAHSEAQPALGESLLSYLLWHLPNWKLPEDNERSLAARVARYCAEEEGRAEQLDEVLTRVCSALGKPRPTQSVREILGVRCGYTPPAPPDTELELEPPLQEESIKRFFELVKDADGGEVDPRLLLAALQANDPQFEAKVLKCEAQSDEREALIRLFEEALTEARVAAWPSEAREDALHALMRRFVLLVHGVSPEIDGGST